MMSWQYQSSISEDATEPEPEDTNPRMLRRRNTLPSPTPEAEPMDLDLSPDFRLSRPLSAIPSMPFQSERNKPPASPIIWKSKTCGFGSALSCQNSTTSNSPYLESICRPCSAPPAAIMNNMKGQHTPPRTQTALGHRSPGRLSSKFQFNENSSSRGDRKKGYGIPETDTVFSHYPKFSIKGSKSSRYSHRCLTETVDDGEEHRTTNQNWGSDSKASIDSAGSNSTDCKVEKRKRMGCFSLLYILLVCITILVVYHFPTLHFTYCKSAIQFDREALEHDFQTELFGQHIAARLILHEVDQYFKTFTSKHNYTNEFPRTANPEADSCKPLVLSFHGWTGVGKTFVSRLVTRAFHNAMLNPIIIPLLFPYRSLPKVEAQSMMKKIIDNLSHCKVSVFIVDEMDKAPEGVIKGLSDAIRLLSSACSPWHPVVILLLSNTHATDINVLFKQLLTSSNMAVREDVRVSQFESVFKKKNQWYDLLVDAKQVDAFIPFLPLEKKHAVQCIQRDLKAKNIPETTDHVNAVLKELHFSEYGDLVFSSTGCKRISEKIDYVHMEKDMSGEKTSEL